MVKRLLFTALSILVTTTLLFSQEQKTRVLFIGNSYTGQIKRTVTQLIQASPHGQQVELEFVTPGGKTLEFHLQNSATVDKIKQGKWTHVVLQDQSQTPAIFPDKFASAASKLDKIIDAAGAQTVFYQTWGRRDGDKMNAHLFPDYKSMQKELSANYERAAKRCDAALAPVGETWAAVRKADGKLGQELYKKDGSHPSEKGAYLAACVLYATIFNQSPKDIEFRAGVSDREAQIILASLVGGEGSKTTPPKKSAYPVSRTITNDGGTKIEAQITGRSATEVDFRTKGRSYRYELGQLSEEDQEFIQKLPVTR